MLEWAGAVGEICLKYLDESGFSLWTKPLYTWAKEGEQKRIEQTKKKGKRLNICGLLEQNKSFKYGLAFKSFDSETYIKLLDWQASEAEKRLKKTGKITVIVQDQGPSHKSKLTRSQYKKWEKQGLYIFLLPTYSPELNPIENEWDSSSYFYRGTLIIDKLFAKRQRLKQKGFPYKNKRFSRGKTKRR